MGLMLRREGYHMTRSKWYTVNTSLLDDIIAGAPGKALPVFSQNTNVHPAFGVQPKIERNRKVVNSVYTQTQGYMLIGDRLQETMSDPLHRNGRYILQAFREGSSVSGRSRGMMRPAAPQQVTWKNQYWRVQRPPYMPVIGPYTQGQLADQSILARVNYWLRGGNTG